MSEDGPALARSVLKVMAAGERDAAAVAIRAMCDDLYEVPLGTALVAVTTLAKILINQFPMNLQDAAREVICEIIDPRILQ